MKKILYLECKTGAAGDMIMGALYGLLKDEDKKIFIEKMNSLSPRVCVEAVSEKKSGIAGIQMKVRIDGLEEDEHLNAHGHGCAHHHSHTSLSEVFTILDGMDLPEDVKENAKAVYKIIADAESLVHDKSADEIHFHEVGSLDALADVAGCCLAARMICADEVECSPICLGNGSVECAHGILPVPAPATAEIIKGMPVYCSETDGEMLTPTGAALIKQLAGRYTKKLDMSIDAVGYGFGTRDYGRLTCVRAFLGTRAADEEEDPYGALAPAHETEQDADEPAPSDLEPTEDADPWVDKFLDAENFEEKYEVVCDIKDDITDKIIDDISALLDVVIDEGPLKDRYEQLKTCVKTRLKYENNRLR